MYSLQSPTFQPFQAGLHSCRFWLFSSVWSPKPPSLAPCEIFSSVMTLAMQSTMTTQTASWRASCSMASTRFSLSAWRISPKDLSPWNAVMRFLWATRWISQFPKYNAHNAILLLNPPSNSSLKFKHLLFLLVSDQGEPEVYLRTLIRLVLIALGLCICSHVWAYFYNLCQTSLWAHGDDFRSANDGGRQIWSACKTQKEDTTCRGHSILPGR